MDILKVFVASPGDTQKERDAIKEVVEEINLTHGSAMGYRLDLLRWEENAYPNAGRPQGVINSQLSEYDIFIGLMWCRFGSPTGVADSGTEEEFNIAYTKWEADPGSLLLMFYFNQSPIPPSDIDTLQITKVLAFRKMLRSKALTWDYNGVSDFESRIRKHLCTALNHRRTKPSVRAVPDIKDVNALRELWPRMDKALQDAFSIAYNENRLAGDGGIKTRDLFSALVHHTGSDLQRVIAEIPREALPEPTPGDLITTPYLIEEAPWLSHCISSSIARLSKTLSEGERIKPIDIFVDIAKNGTGESVRQLRMYNIGPREIDAILERKNLSAGKHSPKK